MAESKYTIADDWTSRVHIGTTTANGRVGLAAAYVSQHKPDTTLAAVITTTSLLGLIFNVAALAVLLQKKNRRISTNLHLITLAVGDVVMCTIIGPLRLIDEFRAVRWTGGDCVVHDALKYAPLFVCTNTVVLIAIERWVAVLLPARLAAFASPRNVKIQLALVWLLALIQLLYPMAVVKPKRLPVNNACSIFHLKTSFVYMFMCIVAVPLVFLFVAYGTVTMTVLHRLYTGRVNVELVTSFSGISGIDEHAGSSSRSNGRLFIMCAIVTASLVVCWMPVFILEYMRENYHLRPSRHFLYCVRYVFFCHPIFNPLIYFFVDAGFRAELGRLFRRRKVGEDNISMA